MGRRKSVPNNINYKVPPTGLMSVEERLQLIANIIVDQIRADLTQDKDMETTDV